MYVCVLGRGLKQSLKVLGRIYVKSSLWLSITYVYSISLFTRIEMTNQAVCQSDRGVRYRMPKAR